MPNPFDLMSEELDPDPEDELRLELGQNQGENLAGGPQGPTPRPGMGGPQPIAPSPAVPGPLAAISQGKPRIRQMGAVSQKPRIRIKGMVSKKPRIRAMGVASDAR